MTIKLHLSKRWRHRRQPHPPQEPALSLAAIYRARLKLIEHEPDAVRREGELRAFEAVVNLYRNHHGVDVDTAKAAVTAALKGRTS